MNVTIAICTWNRAELLKQTLEGMVDLEIPEGLVWELIVVNNACTDHTDEVVGSFKGILPVRVVYQREPGLSNARNMAVREALGEYIIWTDDDVRVETSWLAAYHAAFSAWPEASIFGGPVDPWFLTPPPRWMDEVFSRIAGAYAVVNLGVEACLLDEAHVPFGANMAVKVVDQRAFLYDPRLGRHPNAFLHGEETSVIRAMLRRGMVGRWVPEARVRHAIPAHRMTRAFLRRYFIGHGYSQAERGDWTACPTLAGRPRWVMRQYTEGATRYLVGMALRRPQLWVDGLISMSLAAGVFKYLRERSRDQDEA